MSTKKGVLTLPKQSGLTSQTKPKLTPIVGEVGDFKLFNWHGFKIVTGRGKSSFILDEIQYRRKKIKQNAIVVVGQPGEGKSYFALRLAQVLDPRFNLYKQIVFERTHLLWLLGPNTPLKMGQVIIIDEAQFIAGARRWYEDVQKDVMEHIEAIRSKGFVVIIVALHLNLLDKIIRKYVLTKMMLMRERGEAVVYSLHTPPFQDKLWKSRMGFMSLQLPDFEKCSYANCLICKYLDKCMTVRAVYERLKKKFLDKMSLQSQSKAAERERKKIRLDFNDLVQKAVDQRDKFVFTSRGKLEPESVRLIFEDEYGLNLGTSEINRVLKRGKIKHPKIFVRS